MIRPQHTKPTTGGTRRPIVFRRSYTCAIERGHTFTHQFSYSQTQPNSCWIKYDRAGVGYAKTSTKKMPRSHMSQSSTFELPPEYHQRQRPTRARRLGIPRYIGLVFVDQMCDAWYLGRGAEQTHPAPPSFHNC